MMSISQERFSKSKNDFVCKPFPYRIKDFMNEHIKGNFYESELQKVDKDEDTLWYIEKEIRKRKREGQIQWLVKFEGWPDKYNQ